MSIANDITALQNERLLNLLSMYLNDAPTAVSESDILALSEFGVSKTEAFALTLAGLFSLDIADNKADRQFFNNYFLPMIHMQNVNDYYSNPYMQNISLDISLAGLNLGTNNETNKGDAHNKNAAHPKSTSISKIKFQMQMLEPYEGFVLNDFELMPDGKIIPQIGFFDTIYKYPALLEDGRPWMTLLPNEINSQQSAIDAACGNVLTFGLGIGYFAYMVAQKSNVAKITVVEKNEAIIKLFCEHILPQFEQSCAKKIDVVCDDAFDFAKNVLPHTNVNFVYTDLWHDVGDGIDLYKQMKALEHLSPNKKFMYWIEKTMLCYL